MTAVTSPQVTNEHLVSRVMDAKDADGLIGAYAPDDLVPTFRSPSDHRYAVRLLDRDTGQTVMFVQKLPRDLLAELRMQIIHLKYGQGVARHRMRNVGATFGYAPRKPIARQEGCRMTMTGRDHPSAERVLEKVADYLSEMFELVLPGQAQADRNTIEQSVLAEWRIGARSLWTSGVINQMNVLPYHRDRNNLKMWSAMPTLRFGMSGGLLHVPEYGIVVPCGDGDVTWFYGRGLVHGNTPLLRTRSDGYRYSVVYYALKGMTDCATYAEETAIARRNRTARERAEAAKLRGATDAP